MLACAACAAPGVRPVELGLSPIEGGGIEGAPTEGKQADAAPWWRLAGDPVLEKLLDEGLAHDQALACDAHRLAKAEAAARRRHPGSEIIHLFRPLRVPAGASAQAYAHAALVNRRAAAMAQAYLDARLAQARLTARREAIAPWRDNAEIARFRREAGLVSAIDGALGGVMVDLDDKALASAETAFAAAVVHLAGETGLAQDAVMAALVPASDAKEQHTDAIPVFAPLAQTLAQTAPRRAALMAQRQSLSLAVLRHKTTAQQARAALASASAASAETIDSAAKALDAARALSDGSARTLDQAQRTVRDARLGYRAGSETFATLYVAEASALAAREADARARHALALAHVRLWTAQALGWSPADLTADLTPAPVPAEAVKSCD
ncbi:MAG: hypothetical protein OC190_02005 [Novosphingobium aromaticivorans]|nr:hypothetical protein [Novosphingobium aromaticivorans]